MIRRPDFQVELSLGGLVCGIDEAGRGPWAGPVLAAAVILDPAHIPPGIDDSKVLTPRRRDELAAAIKRSAHCGIGAASIGEIALLNILGATWLAMRRAVAALPFIPDHALVDGNRAPVLPCLVTTLVGGDGRSLSIAAASIIAKTTRDRLMCALALRYPGYGWERNKGYGTADHSNGLAQLGATPHHRLGFAPVIRLTTQNVVTRV